MSFYYYKVIRAPEKPPTYGFRKAEADEIATIVQRVSRPTYSTLVQTEEKHLLHNYVHNRSSRHRTPSACRRRRSAATLMLEADRRLTDWELQRVVRRLEKPTENTIFRRATYEPDDTRKKPRSKTAEERIKGLERLSRPTTASRAKSVADCHLCEPDELRRNKTLAPFEYEYADEREMDPEVVDEMIQRVRTPTHASRHGVKDCSRLAPVYVDEVAIRKGLPLVSGLAKSGNVQEIVQRLHPKKGHGYKTKATEIVLR